MKYDLRVPCKNCPFRKRAGRIVFRTRERAMEIEESAYRNGFPCHLSAELVEDEDTIDGESGGYTATANSQHCIGALIMWAREGSLPTPGMDNDEDLAEEIMLGVATSTIEEVFDGAEAFFAANGEDAEPL